MGGWCRVVNYHISIMIDNLGKQNRLIVNTTICNRCISGCHLIIRNTITQSTQCTRLCLIREQRTIAVHFLVYQCCISKLQQILECCLRCLFGNCLYRTDIDGACDALTDRTISTVSTTGIPDFITTCILIWLIVKRCCKTCLTTVDQRCICCYDLERGTRLSLCLRCTVKCTVYRLRTTSAYQCFYIAGMLIHDRERKLWLRRYGKCLSDIRSACLFQHRFLECIGCGSRILFTRINIVILRITCLFCKIISQITNTIIIIGFFICSQQSQTIT